METDHLLEAPRTPWPEVLASLCACVAPLAGGMAHGFSSPAIPELEQPEVNGGLRLNPDQVAWFAAALTVGAVIGGPMASLILDRWGRKLSLIISALPLNLGWLMLVSATSPTVWLLHLSRVVIGIGVGMGSAIAPVYIAEIASPNLRGLLGTFFQTCIMFGLLLTYLFGIALHYTWLAIVSSLVASLLPLLLVLLNIPETPRWLLSHGHYAQTVAAIKQLRNYTTDFNARLDYEALRINMATGEPDPSFQWRLLWTDRGIRKAMTISLLCMVFQQFSGMNALAFYAQPVFLKAGFGSLAGIMTVLLAAVVTIGTAASSFVLDRLGRKKMLVISGSIMCISCVVFAVYSILSQRNASTKHEWYMKAYAFASLACYVGGFSLGWGPAPWVIMSEILPYRSRAVGSSIATSTNWICAFVVVRGFQLLEASITNTGTFFLFAGFNLIAVIFALVCVPETKGKSLEDIECFLYGRIDQQEKPNDT